MLKQYCALYCWAGNRTILLDKREKHAKEFFFFFFKTQTRKGKEALDCDWNSAVYEVLVERLIRESLDLERHSHM